MSDNPNWRDRNEESRAKQPPVHGMRGREESLTRGVATLGEQVATSSPREVIRSTFMTDEHQEAGGIEEATLLRPPHEETFPAVGENPDTSEDEIEGRFEDRFFYIWEEFNVTKERRKQQLISKALEAVNAYARACPDRMPYGSDKYNDSITRTVVCLAE